MNQNKNTVQVVTVSGTPFAKKYDENGKLHYVSMPGPVSAAVGNHFYPACGSVELIDSMGSDLSVVNAARVSFNKESHEFDHRDEKLVNFLARHNHWTPFSQVQFQFRIKMPFFVARQYFKHTVGLTRNEVSRRYVRDEPQFWLPLNGLRKSAENVKQGSSQEIHEDHQKYLEMIEEHSYQSQKLYEQMLEAGICAEQARIVLPQNTFTEFIETGSLAAYARIYGLRAEKTAQKEIQDYAIALGLLIEPHVPASWKALTSHE